MRLFKSIFFVICCVLVIGSCRKSETNFTAPAVENNGDGFFTKYQPNNTGIASIIDVLKREDNKSPFAAKTAQKLGIPRWDKTVVKKRQSATHRVEGVEDTALYYVALCRANEDHVNSILVIRATNSDTSWAYLCDWQYHSLLDKRSSLGDAVEKYAIFFVAMDKSVFGTRTYDIKDDRLFPNFPLTEIEHGRRIWFPQQETGRVSLAGMETCLQFAYCTSPSYCGSHGGCDAQTGCVSDPDVCGLFEICWEDGDDFVDMIYPPSGGGGGGGGGGWSPADPNSTPPDCGGGLGRALPNACDPGWEPIPIEPFEALADDISPYVTGWYDGRPILNDNTYVRFWGENNEFWTEARDFANLLNVPGSNVHELTSVGLRNIGIQRGWSNNVTPVEFNRKVGKAFEETALQYYGLDENRYNYNAPDRALRNAPNPPTKVRPDALDKFSIHWYDQQGTSHIYRLPFSFAAEVKAYSGTLQLSSNNWQILGELELLQRECANELNTNPLWQNLTPPFNVNTFKNGPVLFFITTDDTVIGQSIISEAQSRGITIWQVKAIYNVNTGQISFGPIKMVYDKSGQIPPGGIVPPDFFKSVMGGGFRAPTNLLTPVQPNFDLDPETIE